MIAKGFKDLLRIGLLPTSVAVGKRLACQTQKVNVGLRCNLSRAGLTGLPSAPTGTIRRFEGTCSGQACSA